MHAEFQSLGRSDDSLLSDESKKEQLMLQFLQLVSDDADHDDSSESE
jgi:hypothetical protein